MISARNRLAVAVVVAVGLGASPVLAEVTMPNVFSDHMVMQRRQANKVWGKAAPGEKVTVTIGSQTQEATAGADGAWQVMLKPMEVGEPVKLVAKGATNEVAISDVLVGEVWVASGQSNMAYGLGQSNGGDVEVPLANHPNIRFLTIPSRGSQTPIWSQPNAKWVICTPQTARQFSAVGYYFAKTVNQSVNVPVGIINNAWSGSRAEAWVDRKYFDGHDTLLPIVARYDAFAKELTELQAKGQMTQQEQNRARALQTDVNGDDRPANAWNGIVASHAGYGIKGVLWYQGEGNTPRGHQYRELFPLLIGSWRKEWNQPDMPFYWVNLPGNGAPKAEPGDSQWAELREAQTLTMAKVKNTGQALAIDLGGDGDLHPREKKEIGLRLAAVALAKDYGVQKPYLYATYKAMKADGNKITLTFESPNGKLQTLNGDPPRGFAIAGADKKYVWAEATLGADGSVTVSSDKVPNPVAVRYAWADNPVCNVYDAAKLPLTPFRTDDWQLSTAGVLVH